MSDVTTGRGESRPASEDWLYEAARAFVGVGPAGWRRLEAVVALTVVAGVARADWFDEKEQSVRAEVPEAVLELVREHRSRDARKADGPWWRMTVRLTVLGEVDFELDYGAEPFPDDQLFAPEAYAADLLAHPRSRLPVWLAAYVRQEGSQRRSPKQAAQQARADRSRGQWAAPVQGLPTLSVMWARWAVLAAVHAAIESPSGPRVLPSFGMFETEGRSGSSLYLLPGDRAVLSGGVWDAADLDAAYNGGAVMPDYYLGAPDWVANPVLNPRAGTGLLSFCFWWDGSGWYRGESADVEHHRSAIPEVLTAAGTADAVCEVLPESLRGERLSVAMAAVAAAERATASRDAVSGLFSSEGSVDIDGALYQLSLAGLIGARAVPNLM
ncbi:hypothetical protein [Nocardia sp. NPDC058666]|uniref:hypothetical protein n=1 Tax=unclassified Nocardia TaxID=2637762 RepID=UPI003655A0A7